MQKNIAIALSAIFSSFSGYAMEPIDDNPLYMQYPKEYEKFKQERLKVKSNFDSLPDAFNTHIRPDWAKAISTKFNHALLNHNYQQKKTYRIKEIIKKHTDAGFYAMAEQAAVELSYLPEIIEPQVEQILKLIHLQQEKNKIFKYHDGTYARVPDVGYNYASWDETPAQKKIIPLVIPNKGEYTVDLYGHNQKYEDFSICFLRKKDLESDYYEFSIISKTLGEDIDTFSTPSKIIHSALSNDSTWLALATQNNNTQTLNFLNIETKAIKTNPVIKSIQTLTSGHHYPFFLACCKDNCSVILPLLDENILGLPYDSFDMPISTVISPDDHKFIIYADKKLNLYVNQSKDLLKPCFRIWTITAVDAIAKASFTCDSKMIIIAFQDGDLLLLDASSGKQMCQHKMKWGINPSHNISPLFLCSPKNQLLASLDPVPAHNSDICTFVVRSLKTGRILTAYNFYPTSPCAMGFTQDERSIVFIHPNQTVSQLNFYNDQDLNIIDFIENKADIYQLYMLLSICKKYKAIVKKDMIINPNTTPLVMAIRDYIQQQNGAIMPK